MLYALLCGSPPFFAKEKADIFDKITEGVLKMDWGPWRRISEGAKDLVRRMLTVDPDQRITSAQVKSESQHSIKPTNFFLFLMVFSEYGLYSYI